MAVVPPAVVAEVKSHPDLSFVAYFRDAMAGKYTRADRPFYIPNLFDVIKKNYMRSLGIYASQTLRLHWLCV